MANNVVKQKFHPLSIHLHRRDADNNRGRNERNKKRKTRRMIYGWLRFIIGLTFEVYCCKWYRCGIKLLETSEKKTSSILLQHSKLFCILQNTSDFLFSAQHIFLFSIEFDSVFSCDGLLSRAISDCKIWNRIIILTLCRLPSHSWKYSTDDI